MPLEVDSQVKGRPWSRLDRPVDMHFRGVLNCSELVAAGVLEMQLADQDKLVERIKDRKNELQAFVNEVSINVCLDRFYFGIFMCQILIASIMPVAFGEILSLCN